MSAVAFAFLVVLQSSSGVMQDAPPPPPDPSAFEEAPPPPPDVVDEAPPFDPHTASEAVVEGSVEERTIGGLGWHLVRRSVDEVRWRGGAWGNEVTLVKQCVTTERPA